MYEHKEKLKENKGGLVANSVTRKKAESGVPTQFVDNQLEVVEQQEVQEVTAVGPDTKQAVAINDQPAQFMTFKRFAWKQNPFNKGWVYNAAEKNMLAIELNLKNGLDELKPFTKGVLGTDILVLAGEFLFITSGDYEETEYDVVLNKMTDMQPKVDTLKEQAFSADLGDSDVKRGLTTATGGGAMAKDVIVELLKVYAALPSTMTSKKNKGLIAEAIYPDVRASSGFYNDDMGASTAKFAKTRGVQLTKIFKQLDERVTATWETVKVTFNIDGDPKAIELTGSDFHNEGQQVAIVESTSGQKVAYKPRSVSPDKNITGEGDSAFDDINDLSDGTVELPTMKMEQHSDDDGDFSFVEFQDKATVMTGAEIKKYYERFGEMVVAAKLLGMNDLHNENIMSKVGTPTIIDAETGFIPFVMDADSYARTEIGMSLTSVTKFMNSDAAENFFYTQAEKNAYDLVQVGTFEDYINNLRGDDLNGPKTYIADFNKGLNNVIDLVKAKGPKIAETLFARMKNVKHVRVVPFGTQDFLVSIRSYRRSLAGGDQDGAEKIVTDDVTKMKTAILLKGFSIASDEWAATVTSKVGKSLKADYEAGDTPILHFEPGVNQLHYHSLEVGFSENWEEGLEFIKSKVRRIAYVDPAKIRADLGVGN